MPAPKGHAPYNKNGEGGRPSSVDLDEEARLFREWADKEDSLIYRQFVAIRGYYGQEVLHEYSERSDRFAQAFNYARCVIGARRELYCLLGKIDRGMVNRYASLYDSDLKKHDLELRKAAGEAAAQYVFVPKKPFEDNANADSGDTVSP